mmetsp:Transcript_50152/g.107950  ORF Transcript_50152/g.107950 Transcript_50152/m.107950 type:complete len:862 (-) Transcript_50152:30-2615(-)
MAATSETAGAPSATAADLQESIAKLRRTWQNYALAGLGDVPQSKGASAIPSSIKDWRGISVSAHSLIPAHLGLKDRLPMRAASRAWRRAAESGEAQAAWMEALPPTLSSSSSSSSAPSPPTSSSALAEQGGGAASLYARAAFLNAGPSARIFQLGAAGLGDIRANGRLRFRQPTVGFPDGTAAALVDVAPVSMQPDLRLSIYDMASLGVIGSIPMSMAKHGKSLSRPCTLLSIEGAVTAAGSGAQGLVVALEKMVVVFTWLLSSGSEDASAAAGCNLQNGRAEEVRWSQGGKEVLRSASFAGGPLFPTAAVAVLLESTKEGPVVELYRKVEDGPLPYVLYTVVPIKKSKGLPGVPGAVHGDSLALWAKNNDRTIEFARLPKVEGLQTIGGDEASGVNASAAAAFARARQASRNGKLCVAADGSGAGLDMEATQWGYLVEEIEEDPGQPDLEVGDIITSIGGQALYDLDEEGMEWRFGRNFADGAELTILPKENAKTLLETAGGKENSSTPATQQASSATSASRGRPATQGSSRREEEQKRQTFTFSARLEAWCVNAFRDPPRLIAVADNRVVIADFFEEGVRTLEVLPGAIRPPMKRPVDRVALLHKDSDILLVGVAGGVMIWRIPAIIRSLSDLDVRPPQQLTTLKMPPHSTLLGASFGVSSSTLPPMAWVAADPTSGTDGSFDVWQFYSGTFKPALQALDVGRLSSSAFSSSLLGDALTQSFKAAGKALDKVSTALEAATKSDAVAGKPLTAWVPKLKQDKNESLYAAVDKAEPVCADAVRDLRRWLRNEGRGSGRRQHDAQSLVSWIEEYRRQVLWPLQQAFLSEVSDAESEDLGFRVTAANARSTGAAAGTVPRGSS